MKKKKILFGAAVSTLAIGGAASADIWINEFHYDNAGTDAGEFIEVVVGPTNTTPLNEIFVDLYNGSGGASYNSFGLDTFTPGDVVDGFAFYFLTLPSNGIQNGAPDGLALSTTGGGLIEFLSYEGDFVGAGGPADGVNSVDIGVEQGSATPVGSSLGLTGTGTMASSFTWAVFDATGVRGDVSGATPGSLNVGQTIPAPGALALLGLAGLAGTRRRRK